MLKNITSSLACLSIFFLLTAGLSAQPALPDGLPLNQAAEQIKTLAKNGDLPALMALFDSIFQHQEANIGLKLQAGQALSQAYRSQQEYEKQVEVIERLQTLPLTAEQLADTRLDLAQASHRLRNFDQAYALETQVANDASLSPVQRVRAFRALAHRGRNRPQVERPQVVVVGKSLLQAGFPAAQHQQVHNTLAELARYQAFDLETLGQLAQDTLAKPDATTAQRLAATNDLVWIKLLREEYQEAEKLAVQSMQAQELQGKELWQAWEMYGMCAAAQNNCDLALERYREILKKDNSEAAQKHVENLIYGELLKFKRFAEAAQLKIAANDLMAAAEAYRAGEIFPKAKELAAKVLADANLPLSTRRQAFHYFLGGNDLDRQIRAQYGADYAAGGDFSLAALKGRPTTPSGVVKSMYLGDYQTALELAELATQHRDGPNDYDLQIIRIHAASATGQIAKAAALTKEAAANQAFTAAQRYRLTLLELVYQCPNQAGVFRPAWQQAEQQFSELAAIDNDTRSAVLVNLGQAALLAKKGILAADIELAWNSLFEPAPRKNYPVLFSSAMIHGISDWERLPVKPEIQYMDRRFGGKLDFLVTDVSTGDRGAGIGASDSTDARRPTELSVVADVQGVHFLFRGFDPLAAEVESRLASGGSYEMYLAPGVNQPYFCVLGRLHTGRFEPWNTTYDNESHRRLKAERGFRSEHRFLEDGYLTYLFFDWNLFYDKLPEQNDIWEFENVHWSRQGGFGWNGTKSIHGRSTWGMLTFNINDQQLTNIKRRLVFRARDAYQNEKETNRFQHGAIEFWRDKDLGDEAFGQQVVEPMIEKLDQYLNTANTKMSDAEVNKVFAEAVPKWAEIDFKIEEMRRKYLQKQLLQENK